jgi:hypothetical protein
MPTAKSTLAPGGQRFSIDRFQWLAWDAAKSGSCQAQDPLIRQIVTTRFEPFADVRGVDRKEQNAPRATIRRPRT